VNSVWIHINIEINIATDPEQFLSKGDTKMSIIKYLRKLWAKDRPEPAVTYIEEQPCPSEAVTLETQPSVEKPLHGLDGEIDLSRHADLEMYAKDVNVSRESIEQWISSGLLMPEELKMAEKLLQLMRKH
jgi:hypothetical protein